MILTGLTLTFLKQFGVGLGLTLPLLLSLAGAITLLGQAVGRKEGWSRFDSFYWSFVTATTVGYGDIRPVKHGSRILTLVIAFSGLVLSGIVIAVAVQAATLTLKSIGRSTPIALCGTYLYRHEVQLLKTYRLPKAPLWDQSSRIEYIRHEIQASMRKAQRESTLYVQRGVIGAGSL